MTVETRSGPPGWDGLTAPELAALASELDTLGGARVQKIHAPSPRSAVFDLRLPGRSHLLLVDADPARARAGVVSARPDSPPRPFAFQGLLRAQLEGARLEAVAASEGDRLLFLRFLTPKGPRSLVAELIGREGNLVLLGEADAVLGWSAPAAAGRPRRGERYRPPDPPPKLDRRERLSGLRTEGEFPLSAAVERLFSLPPSAGDLARRKAQVLAPLRAARKRLQRTAEKVRADRARLLEAETFRRHADLLKAQLGDVPRGASEARVHDWATGEAVIVPLDPALSARENVERWYHQARRLSRSAPRVDARLQEIEGRLARTEALLREGEQAGDAPALERLLLRAETEGLLAAGRPAGAGASAASAGDSREVRLPYREFLGAGGQPIRVGRSARDNDALTFRHARGNDLWLHARGVPGSHVVVPAVGPEGADEQTLLDAAALAAYFSSLRDEPLAEVAVTRCKYVRRAKGGAPGAVHYSQERTLRVRRDEALLARLLGRPPTPA